MKTNSNTGPLKLVLFLTIAMLVLGFALFYVAADSATAQSDNATLEHQLGNLDVHSVEYDERDLTAEITMTWRGSSPETTTFTQIDADAGVAVIEDTRLRPGEETTLSVDLASDEHALLYTEESMTSDEFSRERAVVLEFDESYLFYGPWSAQDAQLTGIAGLAAGLFMTVAIAFRKISSSPDKAERVL